MIFSVPFPVYSSTSEPHLHMEPLTPGALVNKAEEKWYVLYKKCYSYCQNLYRRSKKDRRATPASKPTCNKKGTTCTPPWNSIYPCPIPSNLAKCFHPCLNSCPRPQVLYTEMCTQAFAIPLPPSSPLI